jgi:hypothetical protein
MSPYLLESVPVAGKARVGVAACRWGIVVLGVVVALSIYLRFANLADKPGWDGDEGYNWSIASNLAAGHVQMYALRYTFVQHPPLFYVLGSVLIRVWTHELIALRALSAFCGVLTVVGIFGLGNRLSGYRLGFAAAAMYAIWPQAVVQVRFAYTYNLLALLMILALWAATAAVTGEPAATAGAAPQRTEPGAPSRSLGTALLAGLLTGLALATDQQAVAVVPAVILLLWKSGGREALVGLLAMAIPPVSYIGWMLAIRRTDLLFDIHNTASRLTAGPGTLLARFVHLLTFDPLIAVGLIGLLLLPRGRGRSALWTTTALLLVIVLEIRDPAPVFHAAEPILPIVALGVGSVVSLLLELFGHILAPRPGDRRRPANPDVSVRRVSGAQVLAGALLLVPFALSMLAHDVAEIRGHFVTGINGFLPQSPVESRRMAAWVNERVSPRDLVIAMPAISWLFHCRTTELLQSVAISGHGTAFYPNGLDRTRFLYDTTLSAASFLVIDDFTRLWINENVREKALVTTAKAHWQIVYKHGEYLVYANPARPTLSQ